MINRKLFYNYFKRLFDIVVSFILIILLFFPIFIIAMFIIILDRHTPFYLSKRVGKNNKIFLMPKFRTMKKNTPQVATHLFVNHNDISYLGKILRKTSLDELPQLFTIFIGKMSIVGPRPALFNQHDLIELRNNKNIQSILPGLTGLAQINGRDLISIEDKVLFDEEYLQKRSFFYDIVIIIKTFIFIIKPTNIKH
jgi:O-antigen biosynthesis protein WbqP